MTRRNELLSEIHGGATATQRAVLAFVASRGYATQDEIGDDLTDKGFDRDDTSAALDALASVSLVRFSRMLGGSWTLTPEAR